LTALTGSWSGLVVSSANLDSTTYGQGTSFPSSWDVTRLFWRSDLKRLYYNKGTLGTPLWEGADIPVGTINMYAGATTDVPTGWLLCNGAAVSRTTYAQLFAVLDTEYGVGDGSATFNLPDFVTTNKFPRAATNDAGRGTTGGSSTHTLTGAESGTSVHGHGTTDPGHVHTQTGDGSSIYSSNRFKIGDNNSMTVSTASATTGLTVNNSSAASASSAHENKPPFIDVHFIIAV
jgi:microcystin-dependent protein